MDTTAVFIFSESSACSASTPSRFVSDVASSRKRHDGAATSRALGPLAPAMRCSAPRGSTPPPGSQNPITVIAPIAAGVTGVDHASGGAAKMFSVFSKSGAFFRVSAAFGADADAPAAPPTGASVSHA